jgi:hypothetical protein
MKGCHANDDDDFIKYRHVEGKKLTSRTLTQ